MPAKITYEYGKSIGDYGCTYIAPSLTKKTRRRAWFKCSCGAEFESAINDVKSGGTQSCKCKKEKVAKTRFITHGLTTSSGHHPLHRTWRNITSRCGNPKNPGYKNYGGRGITVCDRWKGLYGFPSFLEDVGEKPSKEHSLDRIDNNQGYSKENCRWATRREQSRNTRRTVVIEYQCVSMSLKEWSLVLGINYQTLCNRIAGGWAIEKAFTVPVKKPSA
jgi:hypothetical protein